MEPRCLLGQTEGAELAGESIELRYGGWFQAGAVARPPGRRDESLCGIELCPGLTRGVRERQAPRRSSISTAECLCAGSVEGSERSPKAGFVGRWIQTLVDPLKHEIWHRVVGDREHPGGWQCSGLCQPPQPASLGVKESRGATGASWRR